MISWLSGIISETLHKLQVIEEGKKQYVYGFCVFYQMYSFFWFLYSLVDYYNEPTINLVLTNAVDGLIIGSTCLISQQHNRSIPRCN